MIVLHGLEDPLRVTLFLLEVDPVWIQHTGVNVSVRIDAENGDAAVPNQGTSAQERMVTAKRDNAVDSLHVLDRGLLLALNNDFFAHFLRQRTEGIDDSVMLIVLLLPKNSDQLVSKIAFEQLLTFLFCSASLQRGSSGYLSSPSASVYSPCKRGEVSYSAWRAGPWQEQSEMRELS